MSDVNCCEHGDHAAPDGKRFCSRACAECERADCADDAECAGLCLTALVKERAYLQGRDRLGLAEQRRLNAVEDDIAIILREHAHERGIAKTRQEGYAAGLADAGARRGSAVRYRRAVARRALGWAARADGANYCRHTGRLLTEEERRAVSDRYAKAARRARAILQRLDQR